MKQIKPKNIKGDRIFVKPYQVDKTESGIIIPKGTQEDDDGSSMSPWYEITRVGEDVDREVGEVVLINPNVIKRGRLYDFGLKTESGDKIRESMITEDNIMAEADMTSDLEL